MNSPQRRLSPFVPESWLAGPVLLALALLVALALLLGLVQVLTEQMHRSAAWRHQFQAAAPEPRLAADGAGTPRADLVVSGLDRAVSGR